jgi:signal transduction histidine kinase
MSPQSAVRVRLTALHAGLLVACAVLVLGVSYALLSGHLSRTLAPAAADDIRERLLVQYGLAVAGVALLATGVGWLLAGRALRPLESALEAQERFVANASHELRSPLTVIRTEAEVTLDDPDATIAQLRGMGEIVIDACDRTDALLDGLLALAASQRGLTRLAPVDLAESARRAAGAAAEEAGRRGVHLSLDLAPASVRGDGPLLDRLLANLVENAVRHNRHGGFAELRVERCGEDALVHVRNGGARVPEDVLARLTEPFQRGDRTSAVPGSGLGLSVVRAVAEAHGGSLRLAAPPSGGLEAEVRLPAGTLTSS